MCAIAGYLLTGGRETSSRRLRAALDAMRHRGPDDEGLALFDPRTGASQRLVTAHSDPGIEGCDTAGAAAELAHGGAFGHGRFSIIDPGPEGHQPFWSSDAAVCAAFNGEIYNYVEVRRDLEALGRRFRTASDTEVLVAAYEEWGSGCFPRLNGFWALCLRDARRRQVMLARDRIGKAPLYVWSDGSGLYWASELKGLFALNARAAEKVNAGVVADFVKFQRRDIHGETCYEGVTSFPRASWAWVEPGGAFRAEAYWSLPERRWSASQVPVEEASAEVEGLLREAVRIRLRADVPVCVQLSGGMDSSSTMALAAQEAGRINTYTVKFAEKDADEEPFGRLAAGRYPDAVDYHVISPPDDDLLEHMDGYVHLMGEPFRHVVESARRLGRRVPGLRSLLDRRRRPPARDAFRLPEGVRSRAGPADDIAGLLLDNMTDWRMSPRSCGAGGRWASRSPSRAGCAAGRPRCSRCWPRSTVPSWTREGCTTTTTRCSPATRAACGASSPSGCGGSAASRASRSWPIEGRRVKLV